MADDAGLMAELNLRSPRTHSARLLPAVRALLAAADLTPGDVDLLAVATGPGSFTGLRIGMATAKGLALALDRPLVGFSTLETMALACVSPSSARRPADVCILIDAGRGEVYRGLFHCEGSEVRAVGPEAALTPLEAAAGVPRGCLVVGDGVKRYVELLKTLLPRDAVLGEEAPFLGATLARRALAMAAHGEAGRLPPPTPNYLRLSDAEKAAKPP